MAETRTEKAMKDRIAVLDAAVAVRKAAKQLAKERKAAAYDALAKQPCADTAQAYNEADDALKAIVEGRDPDVEDLVHKAAVDALATKRATEGDLEGALAAAWQRPQRPDLGGSRGRS